ncbi:MAG: GGDEF domain-containing protein [Burkholderiales bacterium]|nr:GGDEF domain-containing protein [Burkholderiales bacterium]
MISGLLALSLAVVSRGERRDGLRIWAGAMGLESLAWALIAIRGAVPDVASILIANLLMVAAQAMKLAAVYEYRGLPWPRWRCLLPILLMCIVIAGLDYDDFKHRVIYGSLIYAAQMWMLLEILRTDTESQRGRAWWLLFGATATVIPIFALRALAALFGTEEFATLGSTVAPNLIQVLVFVCVIALDILGSLGFILMEKERSDFALRALAMTDFLTKTMNRRAFTERAEQEIAMAQRTGSPLALLMIDIDHFKLINDEHGHAAGDAVLVEVARIIGASVRKQDTLGRYGGEEFGVLLPATDQAGALVLAEKLRSAVESMRYRVGRESVSVTISTGVTVCQATCTTCRSDLNQLLDDADKALYQAKHGGRNCTVVTPAGCAIPLVRTPEFRSG